MSADVIINLLQSHPFTEGFWPDHIARLSAMGSEVRFRPDEWIFREGDHSSLFYLLISGNVALEARRPRPSPARRYTLCGRSARLVVGDGRPQRETLSGAVP